MLSKLAIDRFQAKRPYKVFIELTHCCNLRCPHCYLQDELVTYTDFPNKEDIFKLLNELEEMGVVLVTFTGAECTLHPNFYEIIEYACSKNLLVSILTNSLLLKEADIIKLSKLPIYDIRVSIYGNEEVHDNFVKCKGAYQKVLNNLELMKKYMNNGAASFVITNTNYYTFDDVVSTMKQKGIRLYFSPNIMPTTTGGNQPTQLRLDKDKIKELYSKIPNFSKIGSKCSAGISRFRITPEGILNPCEMIRDISFGNVYYNGIEKCLLSSNRKQWVLLMEDLYKNHSCMNCKDNLYCTICPGVFKLETGSFYGHSEFSCMMAKMKGEMVNAKE